MALAFLGLGTNLGNRIQNLNIALQQIRLEVGDIQHMSSVYRTKAWGFDSKNTFYNAVVLVQTEINPLDLLEKTQEIERKMGRASRISTEYEDRIIDIDILLYDNLIIEHPKLKIPHPQMQNRDFVMYPLSEISPRLIHPVLNKTMAELKKDLGKTAIRKVKEKPDSHSTGDAE